MADKIHKQRNGHRTHCRTVSKKCVDVLAEYLPEHESKLLSYKKTLSEKLALIETLDTEILNTLDDAEHITDEIQAAGDFRDEIQEILNRVDIFYAKLHDTREKESNSEETLSVTSSSRANKVSAAKLPKLTLQAFNGAPEKYQEFWDNFNTAVHSITSLENVTKFTYLKSVLKGQALSSISGLPLTSDSYEEAVKILEMRFGNKQLLINTHIEKLLSIPAVLNVNDTKKLREAYDIIEVSTRNLKTLDVDTKEYGPVLISIVMTKLPADIKLVISRAMSYNEKWDVDRLIEMLRKEIESREMCQMMTKNVKVQDKRNDINRDDFTAATLIADAANNLSCTYCKRNHSSSKCTVITDVKARRAFIRNKGKCFICLKSGHMAKSCQSMNKCFKCGGRHHISICEPRESTEVRNTQTALNVMVNKGSQCTLLQTAKVLVSDRNSFNSSNARIVLDGCSQRSFINSNLRKRLKLKTVRTEKVIVKGFACEEETVQILDVVCVKLCSLVSKEHVYVEVHVVPFICSPINNQFIELAQVQYEHLIDLKLADCTDGNASLNIDLLIGGDNYWKLVTGKVVKGKSGPVALDTKMGWVLSGSMGGISNGRNSAASNVVLSSHVLKICVEERDRVVGKVESVKGVATGKVRNSNAELSESVNKFWNQESMGIVDEGGCNVYDKFCDDVEFDGERYKVKLPWKTNTDVLPDNYKLSEGRLKSLVKRLKRTPERLKEYDEIIRNQEEDGIVESVDCLDIPNQPGSVHYIPHREVIREDKNTTKLRIVYDASARNNGPSLNDCLESGPCLLPKIFEIMARFRSYKYGITSDIKSAFLNIRIAEEDRDYLRFLWVDDIDKPVPNIVTKRFTSVIFGVNSSPFLLGGTVIQHMNKFSDIEPEFVAKFLSDLYMDDSVSGAHTDSRAFDFYLFAKTLMKEGGFTLRKWMTNDSVLQGKINDYESKFFNEETLPESNEVKILGVNWDLTQDELIFSLKEIIEEALSFAGVVTKRYVLKTIASVYDPLGILSPAVVALKLFFQEICSLKLDWDTPFSENLLKKWVKILKGLVSLQPVSVPRYYFCELNDTINSVQLHGFCDASCKAYAAVVYIRAVATDGTVSTKIVASKTRIAPITKTTIPRLELLSCLILSRLLKTVIVSLNSHNFEIFTWSDSMDCLYWINQNEKVWDRFIQNRVVEIRDNLPDIKWQHCPGELNPADLPSRGLDLCKSNNLSKWLNGPDFLCLDINEWAFGNLSTQKCQFVAGDEGNLSNKNDSSAFTGGNLPNENGSSASKEGLETIIKENINAEENKNANEMVKISTMVVDTSRVNGSISEVILLNNYNSLQKVLNITSYVFRFINNLKGRIKLGNKEVIIGEIKLDETNNSMKQWISHVQSCFKDDQKYMKKLNFSLGTFTDKDSVIRLRGRLKNADLDISAKHPILLPKRHYFTDLLIIDAHKRLKHANLRDTLNEVRSEFWVIQGRSHVKALLRKCVTCRYFESKPFQKPPMAPLPDFRVQTSYPFSYTGVDYLGPLLVKRTPGKDTELYKVHVVLYTCASSRAIHLDLVPDNTSGAFVRSLKRFISRRGIPKLFLTDNAKCFVGKELKQFVNSIRTQWEYILERSPWWGGFWERLVKTVKRSLRKILKKSKVTYEELLTLIIEIEGVINSRPLCYLYSDSSVDELLTPSHLMFGRRLLSREHSIYPELDSTKENLNKRVKYLNTLIEHFEKRWRNEYLTELREHQHLNNNKPAYQAEVGQVVLLQENHVPRAKWRLGLITDLLTSRDNIVRGCRLRVSDSQGKVKYLKRPVNKLCNFEVRSNIESTRKKNVPETNTRPKRLAALNAELKRTLANMT